MLEKVEEIYAGVWPCSLADEDLRMFLCVLYLATCYFKPRSVVQTGTFVGTSSLSIALALRENGFGQLHTIDPEPPEYFGISEPVSIARKVAAEGGLDDQICFVKGYSTLPFDAGRMKLIAGLCWQLQEISRRVGYDMLVIDGDHTFFGCYFDLVCGALELSRRGPRLIVVHDYLGIPAVRRALRKWKAQNPRLAMKVVPSPCGIALIQLAGENSITRKKQTGDDGNGR
ncbi:MAG: O-methyltransferase [bacterium]